MNEPICFLIGVWLGVLATVCVTALRAESAPRDPVYPSLDEEAVFDAQGCFVGVRKIKPEEAKHDFS